MVLLKVEDMDDLPSPAQSPQPQQSAPSFPSTPSPFISREVVRPKSRAPKIILGILAGIILGCGGFAYAYFYTDLIRTPESVFAQAMMNFLDAKTFEYKAIVTSQIAFGGGPGLGFVPGPAEVGGETSGQVDLRDERNIRYSNSSKGSFKTNMGGVEFGFSGGFDMILADQKMYMKLSLPEIFQAFGLGISKDQWILIGDAFMRELGPEAEMLFEKDLELAPKIRDILRSRTSISVSKSLGSETIDGVPSHHYQLSVDKNAAATFFTDLLKEDETLTKEEVEQFTRIFLDAIEITNTEIWISKNDLLPRKLVTDMKIHFDTDVFAEFSEMPKFGDFDMQEESNITYDAIAHMEILYSNFNADLTIKAPENAKTFEQILEESRNIPGTPLYSAHVKGNDAAIKANLSSIRVMAELYYDEHNGYGSKQIKAQVCPKGTAARSTFFEDEDVQLAFSTAMKANGNLPIYCALSGTGPNSAYAVSSPLRSNAKLFWCVDSTGASGQVSRHITSAKCPASADVPNTKIPVIR